MIEHLFLDWSGTLADDLAPVIKATNLVLAAHGARELSREEFRSSFRLPFVHFWNHALPGVPLEQIEEAYHRHFVDLQDSVELLPGARELLEACRREDRHVYLLSSIKPAHFEKQSALLGVADAFHFAYTGVYDKCARLPAILAERNIAPVSAMYVGDMVHDIDAARAARVTAIAVLSGYDPVDKLRAARPDAMLENVGSLPSLLGLDARHPPIAMVGAWIQHPFEKRYLLCRSRKWSGKWVTPGGKIKNGETAIEAVRREVAKETGLHLKNPKFLCCTESINDPDYSPPRHFIITNFFAMATSPHVVLSAETQHFAWASLDECRNMTLNTHTAKLLAHLTQSGILHD